MCQMFLVHHNHHWAPYYKSFKENTSISLTKNLHVANVPMLHNTFVLKVSNDGSGVLKHVVHCFVCVCVCVCVRVCGGH